MRLETDRLILRQFEENDMEALYQLLKDEEVNTFLPWFPAGSVEEARDFYEKRFAGKPYYFAICLKEDDQPIGYIKADTDESHDFGYALRKEFWYRGIVTEAGRALVELLKKDGVPYITATHDRNNPRSGGVMCRIGMKYCYSYEEQWQPKDFPVVFRMYQMNLDGQDERVFRKYWDLYEVHFVENVIRDRVKELLDENFRGNVYIVQKGEVLYESAAGFADLANEIPNTLETRFASASAGKVFVAVGILQLIESGKLKLDDTLGAILDMDLGGVDPGVTVEQLLTHTSGVPDYFDESVMDEYEELWTDFPNYRIRRNSDLFPLFMDKPMMYPKGEKFQYNNSGYVLLAAILEKVTGQAFDEYLKANVFDVCGMSSTGYFELDRLPAKCANHYIYCPDTEDYRTNIFSVDAKGTGAGGAFITVKDIVNFWENLLNGKLISREMAARMFARHSGDGADKDEEFYGYGLWIRENPDGEDFVYFQGCDPGVSFFSEYNPNNGMVSVLTSNYGDNVWAEMRKIRKALYRS